MGRIFFRDLYNRLGLNVCEYTFEEHDETVAYSLSIPFVSTFCFCCRYETSGCAGNNVQTPHGNSSRRTW